MPGEWLLLLVVLIICVAAVIYTSTLMTSYTGSADAPEFLYFASIDKHDKTPLHPNRKFGDASGLVLVNSYSVAVWYSVPKSVYTIDFRTISENMIRLIELYPGAFSKLDDVKYIHRVPFRRHMTELESGMYYTTKPVKVDAVNAVVPAEYMRKYSDTYEIITYEQAVERAANTVPTTKPPHNVLCCISVADAFMTPVELIDACDGLGVSLVDYDSGKCITDPEREVSAGEPVIIVGDAFDLACRKYYLKVEMPKLIDSFESRDSRACTTSEYIKYIHARKELFHKWEWVDVHRVNHIINKVLLPQYHIKTLIARKIVHITGPAGVGKTTLGVRLSGAFEVVDTDDITEKHIRAGDSGDLNDTAYEFTQHLVAKDTSRPLVVVGLSMDFSILADEKYVIVEDHKTIYERLVSRTLHAICDNMQKIDDSITSHDISTDDGYMKLVTTARVRMPGLVPPREHIDNDIVPFYDRHIAAGYVPLTADEIYDKLTAASHKK